MADFKARRELGYCKQSSRVFARDCLIYHYGAIPCLSLPTSLPNYSGVKVELYFTFKFIIMRTFIGFAEVDILSADLLWGLHSELSVDTHFVFMR
jgi:hypothetical protein